MIYAAKPWFVRRLRWAEDALIIRRVPADALTAVGVAAGMAAGGAVALGSVVHRPLVWLAVPPLALGRLAANALDGSVARRTGTVRPLGLAVNEVGDRLADAAMLLGAAPGVGLPLALGAVAMAMFVSLCGVVSLALTGRRDAGGPMGKADRVAVLALAATVAGATGRAWPFRIALWTVVVGGALTALARLARLRRTLARTSERDVDGMRDAAA